MTEKDEWVYTRDQLKCGRWFALMVIEPALASWSAAGLDITWSKKRESFFGFSVIWENFEVRGREIVVNAFEKWIDGVSG